MTGVFYHSVMHGLGFFICFKIEILHAQNKKTRFFYVLYSDKTWVFDQSERAQGPVYILIQDIMCTLFYNWYLLVVKTKVQATPTEKDLGTFYIFFFFLETYPVLFAHLF